MKDKVAWNEITKNWTQQLNDFDKFQSYSKYLQINQQNILKYKEIDISIKMDYSIADIVISNNISGNWFKIRSLSHIIKIFKLNMETWKLQKHRSIGRKYKWMLFSDVAVRKSS